MKPWFRVAIAVALFAPATGCSIYFGDDAGDDVCIRGGEAGDQAFPSPGYRNPDNGVCEYGGGGGCGPTDSNGLSEAPGALPDWASCESGCEWLAEGDCLAAAQCRGIYTRSFLPDSDGDGEADCAPESPDCGGGQVYSECWGIAPSGPATGESCYGLDAYNCSRHNDCIALYDYVANPSGDDNLVLQFTSCEPEPPTLGCYSDAECPSGYDCTADTECLPPPDCEFGDACDSVCYGQCVPSEGACTNVDCGYGYHCEERCEYETCPDENGDGICEPCEDLNGDGLCDTSACEAVCVPNYDSCEAIDCGEGYECQKLCYGCDDGDPACDVAGPWCEPTCVPIEPASCDAIDCGPGAHCELQCYPTDPDDPSVPPGPMDECFPVCVPDAPVCDDLILCAPGTHCEQVCVAECTPDGECGPPVCTEECVPDGPTETCESLATEEACAARPDCTPVYTGEDCVCYPWGCVCENLEYERCETIWFDDPATGLSTPLPRVLTRQ
jgi:hypothetical protein